VPTGWLLALVGVVWAGAMLVLPALGADAVRQLARLAVIAACLATVAGVAMFVRWRIDGRSQSWWLALGTVVLGMPGLLDSASGDVPATLYVAAFAVALAFFVVPRFMPPVDSILSIRLGAGAFGAALVGLALVNAVLTLNPTGLRITATTLALGFGLLAFLWRSDEDRPWFVIPLVGCALCSLSLVARQDAVAIAEIACVMLVVNTIAATAALRGLQATATRHRSMALDAERERDLLATFREEIEARYAETMHEVRSIVLALEGGIQVFRPAMDANGAAPELANSLVAELQRLRRLADPEQTSMPSDFRVADALRPLLDIARANGWQVTVNVGDDVIVRGRPADVAQIVHSLLSNAAKYAPGPVDVSAMSAGKFLLLMVDDQGPGVRPAHRERIFERGERPDHDPAQQGYGLGLHIARGLARSLGGELWVEQSPHGGARFVLALRVASAPHQITPVLGAAS
jgi:signal transduction histidine kinase